MRFLKVSALNAVAVGVRMATALVLNKLLAIFVGPGGYAVIGQFQNAMSVAITFGSGATAQGVTRYTAEHWDDEARQHRVWGTAGTVTLIGCTVAGLGILLARGWLAGRLLHDRAYAPVFVALALGLIPLAMNALLLAILNGRKETRVYVIANVAGSLIGLALTGALTATLGLRGALTALALNQSIAFGATALLVRREPWFRWELLVGRLDPAVLRSLGGYALMAVTGAIAAPFAQTAIRQYLVGQIGFDAAGQWDAMNRISALGLLFFASTLAVYYLPRIAEIRVADELRREIRLLQRVMIPAVAAGTFAVYLGREPIVRALFDPRFLPMTQLFGYQMIGDALKLPSWIYAYLMIGRGLTATFIATELAFALSLIGLTFVLVPRFGLEGAAMAYAANYLGYFVAMYVVYRRVLATMRRQAGGAKSTHRLAVQ